MYRIGIIILLFCFNGALLSQHLSTYVYKTILLEQDTITLDSLSISPSSFSIKINDSEQIDYTLLASEAIIIIDKKYRGQTAEVSYRTLPLLFTKKYYNRSYKQYKDETEKTGFLISNTTPKSGLYNQSLIDFGNLDYNGNIARGIGFGNAQSLQVNSSFNFQLLGMITEDIEVKAVISDNNIPIQPEGNTANLQEFDKVFIQLRKDAHYLTVGDFDLKNPKGHFLKFQRNLQGASYKGTQKINDKNTVSGMASFAIARGNFAVNTITPIEGNQGPYRLQGNNGEAYIIVMSGSERVYIDGVLQQRGDNNDYIIDYNIGEIRFTPQHMITQDMRIRVEFEYAERNYLRTLYHLNAGIDRKKLHTSINFFSQQDAKNQSINQNLDNTNIAVLKDAGDAIENAFTSGAERVDFDASRVLYEKKDTLINGVIDSFYVYSTNQNAPLYALRFSLVGDQLGSYTPSSSVANGRVFTYVGQGNGNYAPIIKIIAPEQQQVVSSRMVYKPIKNTAIGAEFALSNKNINTFSKKDSDDNIGTGLMLFLNNQHTLKKDSLKRISISANYEFKQDYFTPIERYREVEFSRNWSLENDNLSNEHLGRLSFHFDKYTVGNVHYNFSLFKREDLYEGYENTLSTLYKFKGFESSTKLRYLYANTESSKIHYIRPEIQLIQHLARDSMYKIGFLLNNEIKQSFSENGDSLLDKSYLWQEYNFFIQNKDSLDRHFRLNYTLRYQHLANEERYEKPYLKAHQVEYTGHLLAKRSHTLHWNLTYRNLQQDTLFSVAEELQHFYLGRLDYSLTLWKGAIRGNSMYELGAGREQKVQYTYVESPNGIGSFAWQDINENGVQELNEFYVSSFANENRFIKFFQNSLEFQPVNATRFNQSLQLNPKAVWFNSNGIKNFIARFSTHTALQFTKKVFSDKQTHAAHILSPFIFNMADSLLVSSNTNLRNIVFFNRSNTNYGLEYTYQFSNSKNLLTSGFEKRKYILNEFKLRWNFVKNFTFNATYSNGFKQNDSDFYFDRKYEYIFNATNASISWLFNKSLRIEVGHKYGFKSNPLPLIGGQFSVSNEINSTIRYAKANNYNINSQFSFVSVAYNDYSYKNEQLQFDMLQGLQKGNNYIWLISIDKTFAQLLQVSVQYDGRKTGISKTVHGGRLQVRAVF